MKILETMNGKVTAELEGKYLTRVVFANNNNYMPIEIPKPVYIQWVGRVLRR